MANKYQELDQLLKRNRRTGEMRAKFSNQPEITNLSTLMQWLDAGMIADHVVSPL